MAYRNTKLTLAALTAAGLVCAGWALSARQRSPVARPGLVGPEFRAGDVHRYELKLHSEVGTEHASLVSYDLRGIWVLSVLDANAGGATIGAQLENATLSVSGANSETLDAVRATQARHDFARQTLFALDARGVLKAVTDLPAVELQVRSMMRAIAACFQVVRSRAGLDAWQVEERDGVGTYTAGYTRASERALRKTKLRYTHISPDAMAALGGQGTLVIERAVSELTLRTGGLPDRVSFDEVLRASGAGLSGLSSNTHIQLVFARTQHVSRELLTATLRTSTQPNAQLNAYALREGFSAATDRARIGGRRVADFVSELEAPRQNKAALSEAQRARSQRAFSGLAALMRREPAAVEETLAAIDAHPQLANLLWDAMGSAGSPAAQAGLRKLIGMQRWNQTERLTQMIDLSLVAEPTEDTVDFLKQMLADPEQRTQATYGLGTAAHNLAPTEPARAAAIVHDLLARLERARGIASRIELLYALGNSGHRDTFQSISAALGDRELQVRIVALDALRFIDNEQVNDLIIAALRNDPEASVRFAATGAAGWRPASDSLSRALADASKYDKSIDVQHGARAALTRLEQRAPGLLAQLEGTDGM